MNLVHVALASIVLGTILEAEGPKSHDFWLRNDGDEAIAITQTYPSCGCTSIIANMNDSIQPGDSTKVTVSFNPRGKGGEFYETATIITKSSSAQQRTTLSLEGTVVTSEETLAIQYPIKFSDSLWLSADSINIGELHRSDHKTLYLGILHRSASNRKESREIDFTIPTSASWGLQNITVKTTVDSNGPIQIPIVVSLVVLPDVGPRVNPPIVDCSRRIESSDTSIEVGNSGQSPLHIYRAYTNLGTDLFDSAKPIVVQPQTTAYIPLKTFQHGEERITLITNDPRKQRFVIRIF